MVIKIYVSGISGNKEVKKRQQRVLLILDSKKLNYEVLDIAEPGAAEAKDFMQNNATENGATISDQNPRHPLPPQIFNDDVYCGDYNMFDLANEEDRMEEFLKLEPSGAANNTISTTDNKLKNGDLSTDEKPIKETQKSEISSGESEDVDTLNAQNSKTEDNTDTTENEKTKTNEEVDTPVGDTSLENGKQESPREDSPEKAEE